MASPDWVRWYPDKWLRGVLHLTNEQRGVYIQIVNVILDLGECDADPKYLGRLCNLRSHCVKRVVEELKSLGKLVETGAKLHQNRAETELKRARNFSESQGLKASKRWTGNGLDHAEPDAIREEKKEEEEGLGRSGVAKDLPQESPKTRAPARERGTRLPPNWQPSERNNRDALAKGVPRDRLGDCADDFRDYWIGIPGQKGCKLDWDATYRNHCPVFLSRNRIRPVFERRNGHAPQRTGPPYYGVPPDEWDRLDPEHRANCQWRYENPDKVGTAAEENFKHEWLYQRMLERTQRA